MIIDNDDDDDWKDDVVDDHDDWKDDVVNGDDDDDVDKDDNTYNVY